ncbi:hypothetical protein ACJX0J_014209, partial [Zea mays]
FYDQPPNLYFIVLFLVVEIWTYESSLFLSGYLYLLKDGRYNCMVEHYHVSHGLKIWEMGLDSGTLSSSGWWEKAIILPVHKYGMGFCTIQQPWQMLYFETTFPIK